MNFFENLQHLTPCSSLHAAVSNSATGFKLKTSVKAGVKTCTQDGSCQNSNHNQSAGLKLKTSVKAGVKTCTQDGSCQNSNHNQAIV